MKKEYLEKIKYIDPNAYNYIIGDDIKKLNSYTKSATSIGSMAAWSETPQGEIYWAELEHKILQLKDFNYKEMFNRNNANEIT